VGQREVGGPFSNMIR